MFDDLTPNEPDSGYAQLPSGLPLLACLICGAAVPPKGMTFHDQWHTNIASAAIRSEKRLDVAEAAGLWKRSE